MKEIVLLDVGESNSLHHQAGDAWSAHKCLDEAGIPRQQLCSDGKMRDLSLWGRICQYAHKKP